VKMGISGEIISYRPNEAIQGRQVTLSVGMKASVWDGSILGLTSLWQTILQVEIGGKVVAEQGQWFFTANPERSDELLVLGTLPGSGFRGIIRLLGNEGLGSNWVELNTFPLVINAVTMDEVYETPKYPCPHCTLVFTSQSALSTHIAQAHGAVEAEPSPVEPVDGEDSETDGFMDWVKTIPTWGWVGLAALALVILTPKKRR
jgi:hypothetical protein